MSTWKMIVYPFGAAVAASAGVLLAGACVFGWGLAEWTEWEGRIVGVIGTIAGAAGAAVGLAMALRAERRALK